MKRITTFTLALMMLLTCFIGTASATTDSDTRASLTLSNYNVGLKAGTSRGEIDINFDVSASKMATSLGVSSIVIYKSNGTRVTTITGATNNGLICKSDSGHAGTYTYAATSGVSYYAEVTIYATADGITDSRMITTSTVKAP